VEGSGAGKDGGAHTWESRVNTAAISKSWGEPAIRKAHGPSGRSINGSAFVFTRKNRDEQQQMEKYARVKEIHGFQE
jgi:hypothetical protein